MTRAYFNYPDPHVTLHTDQNCSEIGKHKKITQRHVRVDLTSITSAIQYLGSKSFRFAANPARNDLWLSVDFGDREFEEDFVEYIRRQFASRYRPFQVVKSEPHDC